MAPQVFRELRRTLPIVGIAKRGLTSEQLAVVVDNAVQLEAVAGDRRGALSRTHVIV